MGNFQAWSSFTIKYESPARVGMKVGSADSNNYQENANSWVPKDTIRYYAMAEKPVTIFITYGESTQLGQTQTGDTYIYLEIIIKNSTTYSSNLFIITLLALILISTYAVEMQIGEL